MSINSLYYNINTSYQTIEPNYYTRDEAKQGRKEGRKERKGTINSGRDYYVTVGLLSLQSGQPHTSRPRLAVDAHSSELRLDSDSIYFLDIPVRNCLTSCLLPKFSCLLKACR
jgi:hypothetical protein